MLSVRDADLDYPQPVIAQAGGIELGQFFLMHRYDPTLVIPHDAQHLFRCLDQLRLAAIRKAWGTKQGSS